MKAINNIAELNKAMQDLEDEQTEKGQILRNQFYLTYDSLKPANILRSTLRDLVKSPTLSKDLAGSAFAMAAGHVSRKIIVGSSDNPFRKLFGTFVQYSIINLVAGNQDDIKSFGQGILQDLFQGKQKNSDPDNE